ncbi:hypothetical protein DL770_008161 [Monosporascus sp. CRB-9-2]|nr:hypothetical protein DL770_008161 [Monosporascus sp. CRB-9-2]
MNNYPIGWILHPSQEFINILQIMALNKGQQSVSDLDPTPPPDCFEQLGSSSYNSIHGLTTPISIGSVMGHIADAESRLQDQAVNAPNTSHLSAEETIVEAPTIRLALRCFVSLTKLYDIVFNHFEMYLSRLPPAPSPNGLAGMGLLRTRGLQLGELPLLDETYSKTYTGVRMLLDTFQSAEDVIGLPSSLSIIRGSAQQRTGEEGPAPTNELKGPSLWSTFQGERTLPVLEHDTLFGGSSVHEGFHGLSMKIQSLKRMLREKMDL